MDDFNPEGDRVSDLVCRADFASHLKRWRLYDGIKQSKTYRLIENIKYKRTRLDEKAVMGGA